MRGLNPYVVYGLIAIASIALIAAIVSAARSRRSRGGDNTNVHVFRYSLGIRALTFLIAVGVPAGLTIYVLTTRVRNPDFASIMAAYVFCALVGMPLFWETIRFLVRITPAGIERRSAWGRYRGLSWDEIRAVKFNPYLAYFIFEGESGQKIRVHALIARLNELLHHIETYLPPASIVTARIGYERLGRSLPKVGNEPILEARPPRR